MPETRQSTPAPSVYQLRVVVRGVSPLIWRRLLVLGDTAVAELHAVLQTAFGWGGEHLHRFVIHGVEYGISYAGGVGFRDDPHRVHVAELGLRPTERFVYDYDFTDGWRLDLRLEQSPSATGWDEKLVETHPRPATPGGGHGGPRSKTRSESPSAAALNPIDPRPSNCR